MSAAASLASVRVSVVIPTWGRERVLVETVEALLGLATPPEDLLVLDQSASHEPDTTQRLTQWNSEGKLRWIRLPEPSIPAAMNAGLRMARGERVLFLDDDIVPGSALLVAHRDAAAKGKEVLVAGRVFQPWDPRQGPWADPPQSYAGDRAQPVEEFMGGNFSVDRERALYLGGFDENFVKAAYRFEADFARRWQQAGGRIWFCPEASIEHLKAAAGGTRRFGSHLRTARPDHAVGAYYYAFRHGLWSQALTRPFRAVCTKHHLRRPWFIPLTLWAELWGMAWAGYLCASGPRLLAKAQEQEAG